MSTLLLVDLENIQKLDLSTVPGHARVMIFYGQTQKKIPDTLVKQAQPLGNRLQWIQINGQGVNALDFHIAYYLGEELAVRPHTRCAILSADTGFDPLLKHLTERRHHCKRVTTLKAAFPAEPKPKSAANIAAPPDSPAAPEPYARLLTMLRNDKARPRKRKGLAGKVRSYLPKLTAADHGQLLQRLLDEGHVTDTAIDETLVWHMS